MKKIYKNIAIYIILFFIISLVIISINLFINGESIFVEINDNEELKKDNSKQNIDEIELKFGELLNISNNCIEYDEDNITNCLKETIVIKAKITSSYSNSSTIEQNYYNIEQFIKNDNGNKYSEIQYWAVANTEDGTETKVISFTVSNELIQKIYNNEIVANQLGNYVDNLWILPSLKN